MRTRTRLALVFAVIVVVVGGVLFLLSEQIRNAPLATSDTVQLEVTVEAETSDVIPMGAPGRDLALMTNRAGNWDIATIAADGTLTILTGDNTTTHEYFPSWSMDGKQMNFISNRLSSAEVGPSQINADGTNLENLTVVSAIFSLASSGRFDWDPSWSPDGTQLLWSSVRDINLELYLIPTATDFTISNATRLTNSGARDWFGAWSPDGKSVLRSSDASGNEDVSLITLETGEETVLAATEWDEVRPAFSLDGETVLYVLDENDKLLEGEMNFAVVPSAGGTSAALGTEPFAGAPVWTPDGTQVAYMSNENGRWQVYVMNTDGTNKRRITPDDGDYVYPVWRP